MKQQLDRRAHASRHDASARHATPAKAHDLDTQDAPARTGRTTTIDDWTASLGAPEQAQRFDDALRGLHGAISQSQPALQLDAAGSSRGLGGGAAHAVARRGVADAGAPLPARERIQRAFGRHDVSAVKSHVGGAASEANRSLGARGFALGNDVAFAQSPDLHLAAHEAAHVVQQRAGVSLSGGVGARGDRYERHADAVADAVVSGRSAEALLDQVAGSGRSVAVQHAALQRDEDPAAATGAPDMQVLDQNTWYDEHGAPLEGGHQHPLAQSWATVLKDLVEALNVEIAKVPGTPLPVPDPSKAPLGWVTTWTGWVSAEARKPPGTRAASATHKVKKADGSYAEVSVTAPADLATLASIPMIPGNTSCALTSDAMLESAGAARTGDRSLIYHGEDEVDATTGYLDRTLATMPDIRLRAQEAMAYLDATLPTPCSVGVNYGGGVKDNNSGRGDHWVVICEKTAEGYRFADPAGGKSNYFFTVDADGILVGKGWRQYEVQTVNHVASSAPRPAPAPASAPTEAAPAPATETVPAPAPTPAVEVAADPAAAASEQSALDWFLETVSEAVFGSDESASAEPAAEAAPPEAAAAEAASAVLANHTVARGETLGSIAQQHYGNPKAYTAIVTANHITNPNVVEVGTALVIPVLGREAEVAAAASAAPASGATSEVAPDPVVPVIEASGEGTGVLDVLWDAVEDLETAASDVQDFLFGASETTTEVAPSVVEEIVAVEGDEGSLVDAGVELVTGLASLVGSALGLGEAEVAPPDVAPTPAPVEATPAAPAPVASDTDVDTNLAEAKKLADSLSIPHGYDHDGQGKNGANETIIDDPLKTAERRDAIIAGNADALEVILCSEFTNLVLAKSGVDLAQRYLVPGDRLPLGYPEKGGVTFLTLYMVTNNQRETTAALVDHQDGASERVTAGSARATELGCAGESGDFFVVVKGDIVDKAVSADNEFGAGATAVALGGIEVDPADRKPGDLQQSLTVAGGKATGAGHSSQVWLVQGAGIACLGQSGSPRIVGGTTTELGPVDTLSGWYEIAEGSKLMWEVAPETDPTLVASLVCKKFQLIEANVGHADDDATAVSGTQSDKSDQIISNGRLPDSKWIAWQKRTQAVSGVLK